MDITEIFIKKLNDSENLKKTFNALICFSKTETGKKLCTLAGNLLASKTSDNTITALHLINKAEAEVIGDIEQYRNQLLNEIIECQEHNNQKIRALVMVSDDYVRDILETEEKYSCNLLLLGIGKKVFNALIWEKYNRLKNQEGKNPYDDLPGGEENKRAYTNVTSLLARNKQVTGVFIENNLQSVNKVFLPIIDKRDVHIFQFVNRLSFREKTSIVVWDAIGIIETEPRMKKLYQQISKRTDGRMSLWDNNEKIDLDFIRSQDLILIGLEGWNKLISSAISWSHTLPSTLIIKDTEYYDA